MVINVFGELWLSYHAKTMTDIERTHDVVPYLVAIAASIAVNYALAWLISRLNAANETRLEKVHNRINEVLGEVRELRGAVNNL